MHQTGVPYTNVLHSNPIVTNAVRKDTMQERVDKEWITAEHWEI